MYYATILIGAMLAVGCDVNGPYCDGDLQCLPYRADAESCPEFRTVPLPSSCKRSRYAMHASARWIDEDGGCFHSNVNGTAPPPGFYIAGASHWCAGDIPEHCNWLPNPCVEPE